MLLIWFYHPPAPSIKKKRIRANRWSASWSSPSKPHWIRPGCTPNQTGSDSLPRDERRTRAL